MDERLSIEAGMNVKVTQDFSAVREDEISVFRGEVIQVRISSYESHLTAFIDFFFVP